MKVKSIKYIKTLSPDGSCGTGYSQPNYFDVTFEDGEKERLVVDIWYKPAESIRREFIISFAGKFGNACDNLEQAYEMYVDEIVANKCCPYSKDKLIERTI